ncbi:MAG: histidinol dehydrogenase [Deltaproteobacteria bacterium]|jgi:histidinol dehydrogenase|nr:histidinol dehydrogenase [Deltaproteobacteria bacterium]MCL5879863.1 histidinol dehydrogenase [Deltaproteobacteria bacterium]MDA8303854.1 histidinol dehydrogenase [Deltaproteobacteria bacterium]
MQIFDSKRDDFKEFLKKRRLKQVDFTDKIQQELKIIRLDIMEKGDEALSFYTEKFDKIKLSPADFLITNNERDRALNSLNKEERTIIEKTIERVYDYHSKQRLQTWLSHDDSIITGQLISPLNRVGVYVPGGKASYPSSVIMNAVPAKAAGVKEIIMVTPPTEKLNDYVIAAAVLCGIGKIYGVGGPQAIFALAYGTNTIPQVDKIVGPGNIYVATAKRMVYGDVDIDMIAGPSEIAIICDEFADPELVAIDMLSQAEHDEMAVSTLISSSAKLIEEVEHVLPGLIKKEDRKDIIEKSINSNASLVLTASVNESIELANELAPEHLELYIKDPFEKLFLIKNAGAVFLGGNTPEAIGDYVAGPSHVLPTGGTARFFSPLDTLSFLKRTSVISSSKEFLAKKAKDVAFFSNIEGLNAHGESVSFRVKKINN